MLADMGACCWELLLPPDRWLRPPISRRLDEGMRCEGPGPGKRHEVGDMITYVCFELIQMQWQT